MNNENPEKQEQTAPAPGPATEANPLARSLRAAAIAAAASAVFGATLIVWGSSLQSISMAAGGILAAVRGVMGASVVAGILLSRRHSKNFPDGLYKIENIIVSVIGVIVLVLAYEIAKLSIKHLDGTYIFSSDPKYALPFFLAGALLAAGMGYYKRRVATEEGCPSLKADSWFSFADAGALVIIGIALTLDIAGLHRVDAIAGLVVAALLAFIGVYIFLGGLKVLLDASVDRNILSRVTEVVGADPGVRKVISVEGRNSGSFIFLHVAVEPAAYDIRQAEEISRDLERRIKAAVANVDSVSIEFSAPAGALTAAVPVGSDGSSVAGGFESAPSIGLLEIDRGAISGEPDVVDNPAAGVSGGPGVHLAVHLGRQSVDVLLLREDIADQDTLQTLQAYGIDVSTKPSLSDLRSAGAELAKLVKDRKTTSPGGGPGGGQSTGEGPGGAGSPGGAAESPGETGGQTP